MDDITGIVFGYEMQQEIDRLGYLPKENAIALLGLYLSLSEDNQILQNQLIHSISNYGEYIEIDKDMLKQ
jgi:hypothetical protein